MFDASGYLLAVGSANGLLALRQTDSGQVVAQQQFSDSIHSLAFSPSISGTPLFLLAIGDRGGSIHLVRMNGQVAHSGVTGASPEHFSIRQLQAHEGRIYSLAFSKDATKLLSAGEDGRLRAWALSSDHSATHLGSDVEDFDVIDGHHVVTTGKELVVHDLRTMGDRKKLSALQGTGEFIEYNAATERIVFTDTSRGLVAMSRTGANQTVLRPRQVGENFGRFAVSRDGQSIVADIGDRVTDWLEFPGKPELGRYTFESLIHALDFSPDGRRVLLDQVRDVNIVQLPSKQLETVWKGHKSTIRDIALSFDGRYFATASKDRQVKIWEWPSGREVWSEMAHAIGSGCVAFAPDGKTLATSGDDRLLRLWRWQQNMLVLEYPLEDWPASKMGFTPDGTKLLVLARNRLRLYDGTPIDNQ